MLCDFQACHKEYLFPRHAYTHVSSLRSQLLAHWCCDEKLPERFFFQATEIRATFFGRAAVTWYPRLHTGRVYTFSRGSLQRASRWLPLNSMVTCHSPSLTHLMFLCCLDAFVCGSRVQNLGIYVNCCPCRSHTSLTHEVQIKFDSSAAIEEADDDLSIPFQK